jgi:hypothetical protein
MDAQELRNLILDAFASVPKPTHEEIAPHRCMECDELAEDLVPFEAAKIPDATFRKHVWDMSLLSADAKRYFLPAWLIRCLEVDGPWLPDEASAVLYALDGDFRWDPKSPYSREQWQAIQAWLDYIAQFADSIDLENLKKVREKVGNEL